MRKKKKAFDCVEMQHRGGARILREVRGMTPEQEMEYWRRQWQEFLQDWQAARKRKHTVRPSLPPLKTKTKAFDCVEMQHRAGQRIQEKLKGMTVQQETEFWRRETAKLRESQKVARERRKTTVS